ncbi:MAG: type II secretion system inner membrane protein GspF [Gammaproteobacteria bacterium]|nr:type II secretion system inner membrane protein GspF [Gammaproteobacteria bacterium]MDH5692934.1 type II secretion system inner membrane protein GspF [Gammaproteobacteria bacterium]
MGAFAYNAIDEKGKETKGVLEGDNARQVRQVLRDKGWMPLSVEAVKEREERKQRSFSFARGVGAADLSLVTRQLATLIRSGLPVEEALQTVSRQSENARIGNMLMGVRSKVLEGHTLAKALNDYPHIFSELYRSTVEAGEQSGRLSVVFERLADYVEGRQKLKDKMTEALIYPALISLVAFGVIYLLIAVVVPKMVDMFKNTGTELPLNTRILIAGSDFLSNYGVFLIIALLGLALATSMILKKEGPRYRFHLFLLRAPLIARVVRGYNTARFARTLAILAASGVPILEAMRIAGQVLVSLPMRESVYNASKKVREGTNISVALMASGYFPPMTVHLIASGESSGKLEEMLDRAADAQEREMESLLSKLMRMIEPLMLIGMGLIVLFIVMSIMMPILDMNSAIG